MPVTGEAGDSEITVLEKFVVLEGLDGAGTTTQLKLLDRRMAAEGIPHFCTGEPTPGAIGRQIRSILKREVRVDPRTVALLFAADRNEHLYHPEVGILAHLQRGEVVISDRYLFSSLAYQSVECPFDYVRELNRPFPLPKLVLFVDTPVAVSQERLGRRAMGPPSPAAPSPGRMSPEGAESSAAQAPGAVRPGELFDAAELQPCILELYGRAFSLFEGSGMRVARLDGSSSVEELFDNIWKTLASLPI
jgi:dTMP kinase